MSDDERGELDLAPTLSIDYAPTSRATCKATRCLFDDRDDTAKLAAAGGKRQKIKGAPIDKNALKITKHFQVAAFDTPMSNPFHAVCFFWDQTHGREKTGCISSVDSLEKYSELEKKDQVMVEKMIERCVRLYKRWRSQNSRRVWSEEEKAEREDEREDWLRLAAGEEDVPAREYEHWKLDPEQLKKKAKKDTPSKPRVKKQPKEEEEEGEEEHDQEGEEKKSIVESADYNSSAYAATTTSSSAPPAARTGMNFHDLMQRPKTVGARRPEPQCAPNCLQGASLVLSGVVSLEHAEFEALVERLGGHLAKAVSGKTAYLVQGEYAGEGKTRNAQDKGVPILNEDEFYRLIETLPANGEGIEKRTAKRKPRAKSTAPKKKKKKDEEEEDGDDEDDEEEKPKKKKKAATKSSPPASSSGRSMPTF